MGLDGTVVDELVVERVRRGGGGQREAGEERRGLKREEEGRERGFQSEKKHRIFQQLLTPDGEIRRSFCYIVLVSKIFRINFQGQIQLVQTNLLSKSRIIYLYIKFINLD